MCLAISTPAVLPSVGRKTSAPRTCLTPLNTSPAPSPVNASRLPSRAARASLGAGAVRYSFTVTDFHRLPLAGLPAGPSTSSRAGSSTRCRRFRVPDTIDAREQASISEQEAEQGAFASAGRKVPSNDIQMTALPRLRLGLIETLTRLK